MYSKKLIIYLNIFVSFYFQILNAGQVLSEKEIYSNQIQKIFDNRCVACHSCLESPCQVNLQSYKGLMRGMSKQLVYEGSRLEEIKPTRMFVDAQSEDQWREKGFKSILNTKINNHSILMNSILLSQDENRQSSERHQQESHMCVQSDNEMNSLKSSYNKTKLSMPYNLAPLTNKEINQIKNWIDSGSPGPQIKSQRDFEPKDILAIYKFESFMNNTNPKNRLISRYLYEHLFLADLYFSSVKNEQPTFYSLIRSRTKCKNPEIISTKLPNIDPGVEFPFYCVVKNDKTIAAKNHVPYKLDLNKINWIQNNFLSYRWPEKIYMPSYEIRKSANPFLTFQSIPVEARYRFLLEDSWYHVMTFIKGPVCNGNNALNSIQNQFYVFFADPKNDISIRNEQFLKLLRKFDDLPGKLNTNVEISKTIAEYNDIYSERSKERDIKNKIIEQEFKDGRGLETIWDGDGVNENAVLTVFRNGDYASVRQGAIGSFSKTAFVLDYSVFERLVYNLVVNFDVFGNAGHQLLSRVYMDVIRMDAENNFIELLPYEKRKEVKNSWYKSTFGLTALKMKIIDEYNFSKVPSTLEYSTNNHKDELISKIIFSRLSSKVRGPIDPINFHNNKSFIPEGEFKSLTEQVSSKLSMLTSRESNQNHFAQFFPEMTYLVTSKNGYFKDFYSVAANKEMSNVSWIFFEGQRRQTDEDSLTISKDFLSTSPNLILVVDEDEMDTFIEKVKSIEYYADFERIRYQYQVNRLSQQFWITYDYLNNLLMQKDPIRAGVIDLMRYELTK